MSQRPLERRSGNDWRTVLVWISRVHWALAVTHESPEQLWGLCHILEDRAKWSLESFCNFCFVWYYPQWILNPGQICDGHKRFMTPCVKSP